jgi:penicillin-binding protein 1A
MGISKKNNDTSSVNKAIKGWWMVTGFIIFLMFFGVFAISQGWLGKLPPVSDLQNPINKYASRVYSADNKLIGTWSYASENRLMVPHDSLPENLVHALVATEDARFYEHSGIDMKAVGRAVVKRLLMGQRSAGGGSTITQQLAKQLYSDVAHSDGARMMQKPIEWMIAIKLEKYYSKEEII